MTEININNLVKSFGFRNVLNGFNIDINSGERVALIGANGSGKTTVFKIIAGIENPTSGSVSIRKGATIGLLSQVSPEVNNSITVKMLLTECFKNIYEIEDQMHKLEIKMGSLINQEELDIVLKRYGKLQDKYEQLGGYEINSELSKICNGFKISAEMLDRPFNSLSGGEKTRVNLASLMLNKPSILLLDEPTNHLDIETLEWFENFLNNYKGTILISSHDRYFLDKVVKKVILIERGKAEIFHGNYSYYLAENESRILNEFADYKTQKKQVEAMKESIKKLREWGKIGDNEGFFKRANCIERRLEKMELLERPQLQKARLPLNFIQNDRSGNEVIIISNLCMVYGGKVILENANFDLLYGEKVCLMGKNGSGKTTLIKLILGELEPLSGGVKLGSNLKIGYLSQHIAFPDESKTIFEEFREHFNGTETQLRATLAKFQFNGENIFKRIEKLSGGEKVRLKFAELIQNEINCLILDEPTNHIDIDTREMLEESLQDFAGTLFFVSHDRYFINKLANKVVELENGKIVSYLGNYDYYKLKN